MACLSRVFLNEFNIFNVILFSFVLNSRHCFAKNVTSLGSSEYYADELNALFALKAAFNDPFLNGNWTGIHCFKGFPTQWYGIQCDIESAHVTGIVLADLHLNGEIGSDAFDKMPELTVITLENNLITGKVMKFSSNFKLKGINLSGNRFYGDIPRSLLGLELLESLQLQDNNLTGPVPEFSQSSLKVFNVSNNNLSGTIPETRTLQSFGPDSFSDNPELCGPPSSNNCSIKGNEKANEGSHHSHLTKFYFLFAALAVLAVLFLIIFYFKKAKKQKKAVVMKKKQQEKERGEEEEREKIEKGKGIPEAAAVREDKKLIFIEGDDQESVSGFQLNELLKAPAEGLGRGVFGNSYKALLQGREPVVVKRLRDLKPLSNEEFTKQLLVIAAQKHPNLLPLLAYYFSKEEKLLVYTFAPNGTLFNRIHNGKTSKNRIPFRWRARLLVARGVARALEHLHHKEKSKTQYAVIHGNLKSTNILLDVNEMALVSDYGFSSLVALPIASQRMISYKSPEYPSSKRISKKSDVWSFGCLLLELLTGRISIHSAPSGTSGVDLCNWVVRAVREEWTAEIFDPEIYVQRSASQGMLKLLQVAIQCCNKSPEKRPEMTEVVRELDRIKVTESSEDEFSLSQSLTATDESLSVSAHFASETLP